MFTGILIPTDLSPSGDAALAPVREHFPDAACRLLHVLDPKRVADPLAGAAPVQAEREALAAELTARLDEVAREGDERVVEVGAPAVVLNELNEGAAYLFQRDGDAWAEVTKLRLETVATNDMFGSAVGLDDGVAVVGAPGADAAGEDSGTAAVFMREDGTWQRTATLQPDDAAAMQRFG